MAIGLRRLGENKLTNIEEDDNYIEYRNTPWDERAFGVKTIEIMNAELNSNNDILKKLENTIKGPALIYFRADSNQQNIKKHMINNGYYIAETSLHLYNYKIKSMDFNKPFKCNLELVDFLTDSDIQQIKNISESAFQYSRFYEDPFIDTNKSKLRYVNWISDLVNQEKDILIYKNQDGDIISFMFYEFINSEKVDLILGGSKNGYGYMTPSFWASIMNNLQDKGVKKIDVLISASNIVIFNIYLKLGFLIKNTMFDYHKKID